jgi:hypothetical protein
MMEPFRIQEESEGHAVLMEARRGHYTVINIDVLVLIGLSCTFRMYGCASSTAIHASDS